MKKIIWIAALLVLLLAACSSKTDDTGSSTGTYPLTGEKASDSADRRTVAVMVNNHPKARPQTGLSEADIVFELLAEGNITRFMALYQSTEPKEVGPVRSAREYYFKLADGYNAIYVYHGAAKFVDEKLKASGVDYINGAQHDDDGVLFKRSADRVAPHNSYLQFSAVMDQAKKAGYKTTASVKPLPFLKEDGAVEGDEAEKIDIRYTSDDAYNSEFRYNKEEDSYQRWSDGDQTADLGTEQPVAVQNVFVIEAHHEIIDKDGRRSIDLESGGKAYLFQKGQMQQLEWKNEDGRIIPYRDGKAVGFVPGKTWISVVPDDPGLEASVQPGNE